MSDETTRTLERDYVTTQEPEVLERLKREWARAITYRVCDRDLCNGLHVPDLAWEEHKQLHKKPPSMRVVRVPGVVGGRPRKEPLFDRELIQPGDTSVAFFQSTWKPIWDTNLIGGGAGLPVHCEFHWSGISLIPDARAKRDDVLRIYDQGQLEFRFSNTTLINWPGRVVLDDQPKVETEEGELLELAACYEAGELMADPRQAGRLVNLRSRDQIRDVTISGRPLTIRPLEAFRVQLTLGESVGHTTGIMCVLYGVQIRGITG